MATSFSPQIIKTVVIMALILRLNCEHDMILQNLRQLTISSSILAQKC